MTSDATQRFLEVAHVERDLVEFKDRIPGAPFGIEMGRSIWEELGSPGKIIVTVQVSKL